jgi:hypothetical protein
MNHTHRSSRHSPGANAQKRRATRPDEHLNVDEPRYLLGQVARAAGISSNLLKAWITRKVIYLGEHDREAHGKGSSRVFTLKRALVVGLAAELVKIGISIGLAGDLSGNVIDMTLEEAGGDVTRIDHLIAVYPQDALSVGYGAARWDDTVKEVLVEKAPQDVSSVVIVSVKLVAEKVLRRLGELEEPQRIVGEPRHE